MKSKAVSGPFHDGHLVSNIALFKGINGAAVRAAAGPAAARRIPELLGISPARLFLTVQGLRTFSLSGVFQLLEFLQPFDPAQPIVSLLLPGGDLKLRLSASHFGVGH